MKTNYLGFHLHVYCRKIQTVQMYVRGECLPFHLSQASVRTKIHSLMLVRKAQNRFSRPYRIKMSTILFL